MEHYYVNNTAQWTGEHEVHKQYCQYFPRDNTYLGAFSNCRDAVSKARSYYSNVDGCATCCSACHTR